jgi:hypothetical protein
MTKRITHLIEEQENRLKLFRTRNLDVKVETTQEDSQKNGAPTPDQEEVFPLNLMKESQQRKVTLPKGYKNQNGKRNTEMNITGKKDRSLSNKRPKIEKLQKVLEGTHEEILQNWNFVGISEQHNMELLHREAI